MGSKRTPKTAVPQRAAGIGPRERCEPRHCPTSRRQTTRQRAVALLTTILLIVLLITGVAQLVTITSTEAVVAGRRHNTPAHELAIDSAMLILADRMMNIDGQPSDVVRNLDRFGRATVRFDLGEVGARCTIRDDAAKFNPIWFQRPDQELLLLQRLGALQTRRGLPPATVRLQPIICDRGETDGRLYWWYDQILSDVSPGMVFPIAQQDDVIAPSPVWSDVVTFWGDGRIALRRVDLDVLEAALEDIQPGLAKILLSARPSDPSVDFTQTALIGVNAEIRQRVAERLALRAHRYAITIDTAIRGDHRRWYVVARIDKGDVTILHRSRQTW